MSRVYLHHTSGVDLPFPGIVRALIGNSDDCKQMANRGGPQGDASSTESTARNLRSGRICLLSARRGWS